MFGRKEELMVVKKWLRYSDFIFNRGFSTTYLTIS